MPGVAGVVRTIDWVGGGVVAGAVADESTEEVVVAQALSISAPTAVTKRAARCRRLLMGVVIVTWLIPLDGGFFDDREQDQRIGKQPDQVINELVLANGKMHGEGDAIGRFRRERDREKQYRGQRMLLKWTRRSRFAVVPVICRVAAIGLQPRKFSAARSIWANIDLHSSNSKATSCKYGT